MSIWSGEKIREKLQGLIEPADQNRIDCAAYTLALGPEVFVTSDQRLEDSSLKGLKQQLELNGQCRIPPGQFAFLLTEEFVKIPNDAIAFISMKASFKFKGLVNVSGFHVDPGWYGRIVFAVYNAGPAPVVVSRGTLMFLIWFQDLDRPTKFKKPGTKEFEHLSDNLVNNMTGQVFSPLALSREVVDLRESQLELKDTAGDRHAAIRVEFAELRSEHNFYKKLVWSILGLFGLYLARIILSPLIPEIQSPFSGTKESTTKSQPSQANQALPPIPQQRNPGSIDQDRDNTNSKKEELPSKKSPIPAAKKPVEVILDKK